MVKRKLGEQVFPSVRLSSVEPQQEIYLHTLDNAFEKRDPERAQND